MGGPEMWLGAFGVGGLVLGAVVGRWWALLLTFLIPVAFIPAGVDSDGAPESGWALVLLVPPALVGAGLGVWLRKRLAQRSGRTAA